MPLTEVVVVEADELQDADFGSDSQIALAQDDELLDHDVLDIENGGPLKNPKKQISTNCVTLTSRICSMQRQRKKNNCKLARPF